MKCNTTGVGQSQSKLVQYSASDHFKPSHHSDSRAIKCTQRTRGNRFSLQSCSNQFVPTAEGNNQLEISDTNADAAAADDDDRMTEVY